MSVLRRIHYLDKFLFDFELECPFVPTIHREDWGLDDPSGGPKSGFETTRDLIKEKVLDLIQRVKNNELKDKSQIEINLI